MTTDPFDTIAVRRQNKQPINYLLTPAARRILDEHGPFCPSWTGGKPCLLRAGHSGGHDPNGGRSRNH